MTNISAPEHEPLPQNSNKYEKSFQYRWILSLKIFSSSNDTPSRQIDSNSSARYWSFLFDNLKRSIEQIYQTCESDPNPLQCQVSFSFHLSKVLNYLFLFRKLSNFCVNLVKILNDL
jgi:hypothetical protein